ncbi:hypothetical protein [Gimesia sp.]|uniref:hypothetical protein n=1 Tax=Gimesia sp. TaxID=2024833 RepID=UPI000C5EB545|nr:hypothetical protein [Gimesia sp.]MAX35267.1 hypothetical protein [Gimesia sp.]HAH45840.1 hypothetical protein [Planctomycetaceae bacterium]HBL42174.1 hypothetical protein [Planctomycetaceae bacterium]|tara:strand:- start:2143 stop:2631 length:489 start_codon:yes stop_codon:yes gene_type:complete
MTLQYRVRSQLEDQIWDRRIYLTERLLLDTIDFWVSSSDEFPSEAVIAVTLHLFSERCNPDKVNAQKILTRLQSLVDQPLKEYLLTWPKRTEEDGLSLIEDLQEIISSAVAVWEQQRNQSLSAQSVASQIVEQIVKQQYVVFHHHESTWRDKGGFGRFGHAG